jgi:hypothetical protein
MKVPGRFRKASTKYPIDVYDVSGIDEEKKEKKVKKKEKENESKITLDFLKVNVDINNMF